MRIVGYLLLGLLSAVSGGCSGSTNAQSNESEESRANISSVGPARSKEAHRDGTDWSNDPAVAMCGSRLGVFWTDTNNRVRYKWTTRGASEWQGGAEGIDLGIQADSAPAAARVQEVGCTVFVRGTDSCIYQRFGDGDSWEDDWRLVGCGAESGPAAASAGGPHLIYVFYRRAGSIYYNWTGDGVWSEAMEIAQSNWSSGRPAAADAISDHIDIQVIAPTDFGYVWAGGVKQRESHSYLHVIGPYHDGFTLEESQDGIFYYRDSMGFLHPASLSRDGVPPAPVQFVERFLGQPGVGYWYVRDGDHVDSYRTLVYKTLEGSLRAVTRRSLFFDNNWYDDIVPPVIY